MLEKPVRELSLVLATVACTTGLLALLLIAFTPFSKIALLLALLGNFLAIAAAAALIIWYLKAFPSPSKHKKAKPLFERLVYEVSKMFRGYHPAEKLTKLIERELEDGLPRALIFLHPTAYSRFYAVLFLVSLAALMPAGVILLILLRNPLFIAFLLSPLIMVVIPLVEVQIRASSRRSDVEEELPFFLVLAASLQAAGLSLYTSFERLLLWRILPRMRREALMVKRDFDLFSHDPLSALENVANVHPNENFKGILLGYTSVLRSGGDVLLYLNSKVSELLKALSERWRRYAESASTLGEVTIALFLMFPSLLVAMAIAFASSLSLLLLKIYLAAILPLLTLLIAGFIHAYQPKFYDSYDVQRVALYAVFAAVIFALASRYIIPQIHLWLTLTLLILTIPIATEYLRERFEITKTEKALPYFLRDITEMMKIGYDIVQALILLPERRSYNKVFDRLLMHVSQQLELHTPFSTMAKLLRVRSWLCRYVFAVLSEIVDSGGGTPQTLESLTDFVTAVCQEKARVKSTTRVYAILGYIAPAFLVGVMVFMFSILTPSMAAITTLPGAAPVAMPQLLPFEQAVLQQLSFLGQLVVLATALAIGVLIAKITDFSVFALHHAVITLTVVLVAFLVVS